MSSSRSNDTIQRFRSVIQNRPPVATGVLPVPKEACSLFFKNGTDSRYVNSCMSPTTRE
jgi:hypothetical protein